MLTDLIDKNTTDATLGLILSRCDRCGKFVSLDDDKVDVNFIPDSLFTVERHDILCGKCKTELTALFAPPEKRYLTLAQVEQLEACIDLALRHFFGGSREIMFNKLKQVQQILQSVK